MILREILGHDEYLYMVMKPYLPVEALYCIRFHSFYPGHREGAYKELMSNHDHVFMDYIRQFNKYDLYSKDSSSVVVENVKSYYQGKWWLLVESVRS